MSFWISQGVEVRPAKGVVLPDGRKRLTRFVSWKQNNETQTQIQWTYGQADTFSAPPTGWTGLYLVDVQTDYSIANNGAGNDPVIICVFEQISKTDNVLTQVGDTAFNQMPSGLKQTVIDYAQFDTAAYTAGVPGTTTAPGDAASYLFSEELVNDGSVRRIKRTFSQAGLVEQRDESRNGGKLLIRTLVYFKSVPATPSGYTAIGTPVQNPNGFPIYTYTFAKGSGLVQENIRPRQDGLREVTHIALGTRDAPVGIVIEDDYREDDGYKTYTVTAMQAADGNADPTTVSLAFERYVPFTYPGRAKAWTENVSPKFFLDVFLSPPVQTLVKATVTTTYQTSDTLGSIGTFWNPNEWATMRAHWVGAYGVSACRVLSYPGYHTTSATPVTLTGTGYNEAVFGFNIYNGEDATITVTGGPGDPGGSTLTLDADLQPAFTDTAGTQWYRRVVVSAAIPSQSSLPV